MPAIKIIGMDQNPPSSDVVVARFPVWEQLPIDGVAITAKVGHPRLGAAIPLDTHMWAPTLLPWSGFQTALTAFQTAFATATKLTHNFLKLRLTTPEELNEPPIDPFNKSMVDTALENVGNAARLAYEAGFEGIILDGEPNSFSTAQNLWKYSVRPFAANKTSAEYNAQWRLIGEQIANKISDNFVNCPLIITLGWEQWNKTNNPPQVTDNYYHYGYWLAGMFDGRRNGLRLIDMFEDSYNRWLQANFVTDTGVVAAGPTIITGNPFPAGYIFEKANSTFIDYPAGNTFMAASPWTGNNFTPTTFQDAVAVGSVYGTNEYFILYQQDIALFTVPRTIDSSWINSIYVGRQRSFNDQGPQTTDMPHVITDLDPSMFDLADNFRIVSVVDRKGITYSEVAAGKGPLFKTAGVNGLPSFFYTIANVEALIADAVAALVPATADWGFTSYTVLAPAAFPATQSFFSFGRNATTNPTVRGQITSAPAYAVQRSDDAGSSIIVTAVGAAVTTPRVIVIANDGIACNIYISGVLAATNVTQDVGVATFNQYTQGAARGNTMTQHFGGHIARQILANKCHGHEEVIYWTNRLNKQYKL